MKARHGVRWGLTAAIILAGLFACLLTGRTFAHALTIVLAAVYLAGTVHLADSGVPNRQSCRVRLVSGAIFAAALAALLGFYAWHFSAESTIFITDDSLY